MQHLQPNTTLQGGKYRIEQKPRYLKVFLSNPADCDVVKKAISLIQSVKAVNITARMKGDLTIWSSSDKPDDKMKKDVEQALTNYYSYANSDNISLKQAKRLKDLLEKSSQERTLLESAIKSYEDNEFRHAFDDYRLCIEYYARRILGSNGNLEDLCNTLCKKMKENGMATHLRKSISDSLNRFRLYQDENVKHHNNISFIDTMTIFTWGNMLLEQMMFLEKMLNWKKP